MSSFSVLALTGKAYGSVSKVLEGVNESVSQ